MKAYIIFGTASYNDPVLLGVSNDLQAAKQSYKEAFVDLAMTAKYDEIIMAMVSMSKDEYEMLVEAKDAEINDFEVVGALEDFPNYPSYRVVRTDVARDLVQQVDRRYLILKGLDPDDPKVLADLKAFKIPPDPQLGDQAVEDYYNEKY